MSESVCACSKPAVTLESVDMRLTKLEDLGTNIKIILFLMAGCAFMYLVTTGKISLGVAADA